MDTQTILDLLLIRFAVIAAGLTVLALIAFAVALSLKRRGRLDDVRHALEPLARQAFRAALTRRTTRPGRRS
ncbi:hypothetical protein [Streptomyces sp. SPB4]|uniref:hypothetical protein n=1 Tax=Streptomyces TaxID=1883 RepID=UPI0024748F4C|nr:hypothetical protein [Streptomyces sp. SPB4]MDH6544406.1 heme exporter protein D [Streptomyces sp. SPB4]